MSKGKETGILRTNGHWVLRLHSTKGWRPDGLLSERPKAVQRKLLAEMKERKK